MPTLISEPIDIGENMKSEVMNALALELTKAKFADQDQSTLNPTSAHDWVEAHLDSVKQIQEAYKKLKPSTVFDTMPSGS